MFYFVANVPRFHYSCYNRWWCRVIDVGSQTDAHYTKLKIKPTYQLHSNDCSDGILAEPMCWVHSEMCHSWSEYLLLILRFCMFVFKDIFLSPVSPQISQFSVSRFLCMCHCFLSQDVEVTSPPDDSISCLAFSPPNLPGNFLIGGSWANDVSYS